MVDRSAEPERRLVVDRFEGDTAVVEADGGAVLDVPRFLLPAGAREGSVLRVRRTADGAVEVVLDEEATAHARRDAEQRLARLRQRDPGGDVVL